MHCGGVEPHTISIKEGRLSQNEAENHKEEDLQDSSYRTMVCKFVLLPIFQFLKKKLRKHTHIFLSWRIGEAYRKSFY